MEQILRSRISKALISVIAYGAKALLITFAAVFAALSAAVLISWLAGNGDTVLSLAGAAAAAFVAWVCWSIRNDVRP